MNPIVACACGLVHIVGDYFQGVALVTCPETPPGEVWKVNTRYLWPRRLRIPRPEQVW